MDMLQMAAKLLKENLGIDLDLGKIGDALKGLVGAAGDKLDLSGLVAKMSASGGLKDAVASWLGDGKNAAVSPDKITDIFGGEKVSQFASTLGVQADAAKNALADVLPKIIDKASSGGALLEKMGGVSGLLAKIKKHLG